MIGRTTALQNVAVDRNVLDLVLIENASCFCRVCLSVRSSGRLHQSSVGTFPGQHSDLSSAFIFHKNIICMLSLISLTDFCMKKNNFSKMYRIGFSYFIVKLIKVAPFWPVCTYDVVIFLFLKVRLWLCMCVSVCVCAGLCQCHWKTNIRAGHREH